MATRLNLAHQEDVRLKIQTSQLVNRLQDFALGGVDPKTKQPIEIDAGRLKAIEVLLRKSLPDLSAVALTGADGGAVKTEETGAASLKLAALIESIAERRGKAG